MQENNSLGSITCHGFSKNEQTWKRGFFVVQKKGGKEGKEGSISHPCHPGLIDDGRGEWDDKKDNKYRSELKYNTKPS